eukprot:3312903-Rhodomonas_salina.3
MSRFVGSRFICMLRVVAISKESIEVRIPSPKHQKYALIAFSSISTDSSPLCVHIPRPCGEGGNMKARKFNTSRTDANDPFVLQEVRSFALTFCAPINCPTLGQPHTS